MSQAHFAMQPMLSRMPRGAWCVHTSPLSNHHLMTFWWIQISKYMQILSDHRGGAYDPRERLDNIDDIRNGLLLDSHLHTTFGKSNTAFLKVCFVTALVYVHNSGTQQTPNFGLAAQDIPSRPGSSSHPTDRLTCNIFLVP